MSLFAVILTFPNENYLNAERVKNIFLRSGRVQLVKIETIFIRSIEIFFCVIVDGI